MGKKSIAVIGEGITEWFYFDSLRIAHRYPFKVAPDFPQHSDIQHMSKLVNDYVRRQYDYVVCLVDMDRLLAHPAEMETYKRLKSKSDSCVLWVETNPCTEFWFLLHFLPSLAIRHYVNQDQAIAAFHTEFLFTMLFSAPQFNHVPYCGLLPLYSVH